MGSSGSRFDRYLAHLDGLSGGVEPRFVPATSTHPGLKPVTAIIYADQPEQGHLTALTYGLSLSSHPAWIYGKPELCISVRSADDRWAWAIALLAEQLRGDCPFCYGDTINVGEPIVPETGLTSFVVFAPAVLDSADYLDIDVGDDLPINIAGMYPIHDDERRFIGEHGLEAFWELDWDLYDVHRPSAVPSDRA